MNSPAGADGAQMDSRIVELLDKRHNYQQEIKTLAGHYPHVVFYGCGAILNSIVDTWNEYVGRKIDFCCDSDPGKWGRTFSGIPCISPKQLLAMRDKCVVFVTVGQFKPVYDFLTENGVASVNLIYKYDLVASEFLATHDGHEIASNLTAVRRLLADQRSLQVFDAILDRILGCRNDPGIMPSVCDPDQYFPADIITLTGNESFVDIGAFNGDTVIDLVGRTHAQFERITCFEVDRINFNSLQETVRQMPCADRIAIHNLGVWDSECDIAYSIGKSQSTIGEGEGKGHVVPLDEVLGNEPVSYIKMDIEGAEPRGLRGAERIIRTQKPRLAICVYHHVRHLWEIPLAIHELGPEYRIFLRHHTNLEYETVCYAVCDPYLVGTQP
jgi:FkbM family methyltransferase